MRDTLSGLAAHSVEPRSFAEARYQTEPCAPSELFCRLFVEPEDHGHYLAPAFRFASSAFERVPVHLAGMGSSGHAQSLCTELVHWGRDTLQPTPLCDFAPTWPSRVVREFGPAGVSDGAWLRGSWRVAGPERGAALFRAFQLRSGEDGKREPYTERYEALVRSLGYPPAAITRWDWDESPPCTAVSYEHGLLGLSAGLFPGHFALEMLGLNLWMSSLGPAPLLERLQPLLEPNAANLRFLQLYDRPALGALATDAIAGALSEDGSAAVRERIARGFTAIHLSYLRWEQAMSGPNVPFTAWDSVLEMVRRKARFAADHHRDVSFDEDNLQQLFRAGGAAHERLLEVIAASDLVCPGDPDGSPFITRTLSLHGPMFDAFTAAEKKDLRAWIASVGTRREVRTSTPPVNVVGDYRPAQDPASVLAYGQERYAPLSATELRDCLLSIDEHPALVPFARAHAERVLVRLSRCESWASARPPTYSSLALSAMLAPTAAPATPIDLDSAWLSVLADARRLAFEECNWLRRAIVGRSSPLERRAERSEPVDPLALHSEVFNLSLVANSRQFMPELLGLNVAIEAMRARPGVERAPEQARIPSSEPRSNAELAIWAVQAFMDRVKEGSPSHTHEQWSRLWHAWRVTLEISRAGDSGRAVLLACLAPTIDRAAADGPSTPLGGLTAGA